MESKSHKDRVEFLFDHDLLTYSAKHLYDLCVYILWSYFSVYLSSIYTEMFAQWGMEL